MARAEIFAVGINFKHVEAAGAIRVSFVLQENARRRDNFFLLAKIHSLSGQAVSNAGARLDFDENNNAANFRDNVNLGGAHAKIPREDFVAVAFKIICGENFPSVAEIFSCERHLNFGNGVGNGAAVFVAV